MLAQTTDSGANNNTMAMEMSRIFREGESPVYWDAKNNHVRCYAHKLALVVKAGLRSIGIDPGHTKPTTTPGREIPPPLLALDDSTNIPEDPEITKPVDSLEDGEDVGGDRDGDSDTDPGSETEDHGNPGLQINSSSRWKTDVVVQAVKKVSLVILDMDGNYTRYSLNYSFVSRLICSHVEYVRVLRCENSSKPEEMGKDRSPLGMESVGTRLSSLARRFVKHKRYV